MTAMAPLCLTGGDYLDAGEVFPVGFVVYEDGVGVSHRDVAQQHHVSDRDDDDGDHACVLGPSDDQLEAGHGGTWDVGARFGDALTLNTWYPRGGYVGCGDW